MSRSYTLKTIDELESALIYLDDCQLECDGMTYAVSYLLEDAGIEHQRLIGLASGRAPGTTIFPHCWIELEPGLVIDYRLRMWLGDHEDVPHGVFHNELNGIRYKGQPQTHSMPELSVLQLLTEGRIDQVSLREVARYTQAQPQAC